MHAEMLSVTKGSQAITRSVLLTIKEMVHRSRATTTQDLLKELHKAKESFETTALTEPCMRNSLKYIFYELHSKDLVSLTQEVCDRVDAALSYLEKVKVTVAKNAQGLIKDGSTVFIYGFSSTILQILKVAKEEGRNFSVITTEARPQGLGKEMSTEIVSLRVPVTLCVDAGMKEAIKRSDVVLLGCDAITKHEVFVRMGGELAALLASRFDIAVYLCSNSWKYDPFHVGKEGKYMDRPAREVWENAPTGVKILNNLYEKLDPSLVLGIISELGVHSHSGFVHAVQQKYPWVSKH
jgi:ribose 1,5-bisphosphate isomerase